MTWERDGTHWPDEVRDVHEVEQVEKQPPAPTRKEWTDVGIHHVLYRDANGRLHRKDGPAITWTYPDGYRREEWRWRDKRHRKDGPAVTATFPDGSRREEWWEDGKFIREERTPAPTREEWTAGGTHYVMYFDAEGRLHREDGPAYSETRPNGYRYEAWRCRGKLYRKDGPAVTATLPDGSRRIQWWEDGKFVREELIPAPDARFGPQTPDAPLIDVSKAFVNQRTVTYDELAKFHEVAEVALCAAKAHPEDYRDEPINWADLSVVDAGVMLSNIDAESATIGQCWYVEIDEASPGGCPKFAAAVRKEIMAAGYDPVSVMTEW